MQRQSNLSALINKYGAAVVAGDDDEAEFLDEICTALAQRQRRLHERVARPAPGAQRSLVREG